MSPQEAPTPHPLGGASVLLTGATGGIGRALAAELQGHGANLTLVARSAEALEQVDGTAARLAVDLRTPDACEQAVQTAREHGGRLDVVINAVGVVAFGPVVDLSIDAMEELFLTNTFVPIMLARAALPHLPPGGAFVNLTGVIAEQNLPGMAAYGASKAAARAFDEALAREARRKKVRVLDARPPHTETGLIDRALEGEAPRMREGLAPEAVAATICQALAEGVTDLPGSAF